MVWPTLGRFRTDRYGIARARNCQNVHVGHDCTPNDLNVQSLHALRVPGRPPLVQIAFLRTDVQVLHANTRHIVEKRKTARRRLSAGVEDCRLQRWLIHLFTLSIANCGVLASHSSILLGVGSIPTAEKIPQIASPH